MTVRAFGNLKRRNEGRWLLAGLLMVTTAMVTIPKAEAQQAPVLYEHPDLYHLLGISGDGRRYIGQGPRPGYSGQTGAYYGDMGGAPVHIGDLGGGQTIPLAITRDGGTIAGQGMNADGNMRAWRYVVAVGSVEDLGTLAPGVSTAQSYGTGISDDGTRVVGRSTWQGNQRGFVWIESSVGGVVGNRRMHGLDSLAGGYNRSAATKISGDGRYAVGYGDGGNSTELAIRWDLDPIMNGSAAVAQNLGSLTGMEGTSRALGVSGNGSVVVGTSQDVDGRSIAFRWREGADNGVNGNEQMLALGTLGGNSSDALAVTRDGRWVVGIAENEDDIDLAFRWSEETGMESITAWLERHGVAPGAHVLETANGISDDGSVVVGRMDNGRGFLARGTAGGSGSGLMDVEEYHRTLYAGAGGVAAAGEFLTWLPLNGAHHRPLMLAPDLSGDMCAWATGDLAQHGPSSTGMALGEVGACTDMAGGNVRVGGSVGVASSWQDLSLGGSIRMQGQYVLSEVDWRPDGTPLLLSLTGMLGSYGAHIDRAYSNGADTAVSSGDTQAFGGVVRLRADWLEAAVIGNTSINPYAAIGFGGLRVEGYSESGGPFPAVFDAQTIGHADIRLGVTAVTEFSAQTRLSTTLEVAHRTGTAPQVVGHVPGLFDFALGGGNYSQTWVRAGLELDHAVNDHLSLSASTHLASNGHDPSISASFGIKGSF